MQPRISVIIPAYNEEKLIGKCIQALKEQTLPQNQYEIIVVDNNSTDKTSKIVKSYGAAVYTYKKMQRVAAARQFGSSIAKGKILAFMDADSFAAKDWLETILTYFDRKKTLIAICGVALPEDGKWYIRAGFFIYNYLSQLNQIFGTVLPWGFNFAIRKSAFERIGGYNLRLTSYDDAEIGLRLKQTFGKRSIYYSQNLKVYTSTRKHDDVKILYNYIMDNVMNYINVVLLKKAKAAAIRNIR